MSIAEMKERMHEALSKGYYRFYTDIDTLSDEEIQVKYANMLNYLSDARTHTDY